MPITLVGESPAVKAGGVLMHPLDTLEVEALPRALPHEIAVDLSSLEEIDSQITVADLRLPEGVTFDADPETLVVKVVMSKLEHEVEAEVAEAAEAAEAAQPAQPEAAVEEEGGAASA